MPPRDGLLTDRRAAASCLRPPRCARAGRLRAAGAWFENRYLTVDDRTLALVRIALGLLLLVDLAKRAVGLDVWYTDAGLLPRSLAGMHAPDSWSFFWLLGSRGQAIAGFVFCALCYTALTLGFWTRLAAALSLVCAIGLSHRIELLTMGADAVIVLSLWWTLLLPTARRFSVDARRRRPLPGSGTTISIGVLGMKLQLAGIYFFNAVHKSGETWREGSAVHYTLWLDRVVTPFAVWLREVMAPAGSQFLSWATRGTEALLPILILSPVFVRWTDRVALAAVFALHAGISLCMNVGLFSAAMMVLSLVLVSSADWNALARRFPRLAADRAEAPPPAPLSRGALRLREGYYVVLLWLLFTQLLTDNQAAFELLHFRPPAAQTRLVKQARFSQSWTMFSPDVGSGDMTLIVDAVTESGERVDPYNLVGARIADPSLRELPTAVGYDVYWHSYTRLVPSRFELHGPLKDWIFAHHERTGRSQDRIVLFWVVELTRASPPLGQYATWPSAHRVVLGGKR
jgi:hypothetical protein